MKSSVSVEAVTGSTGSTEEKPVPEWHAWHWALASAEIPRGVAGRNFFMVDVALVDIWFIDVYLSSG